MSSAGTAFVDLQPRLGAGFAGSLAGKLKAIAPVAAVAALGGALFGVGAKFESTFNKIRVQTGATGATFDKLKSDTKNVLAGTAGTFDQVSAAIGGLYQRTGLVGKGLDDLAKQQVTLARITKTDVATNVEATTSVFKRYGVATRDQSRELDVLFKASQKGGKGIGELIASLQKGAPSLIQFGFGFEKSAALIAGLERAGVNVQPVLTGLRTAFGHIAKEGKDPQKVLAATIKELRDGKNPTLAMADAIKLFGARGGAELSTAIRSGKFDVDALLKSITDGKGGILATGAAVSTIGGKFARLKNIALVALEPIATGLVDLANKGMGKLVDAVTAAGPILSKGWDSILGGFQNPSAKIGPGVSTVTAILIRFGAGARVVFNAVSGGWKGLLAGLGGGDTSKLTGIAAVFATVGAVIRNTIGTTVTFVRSHWREVLAVLTGGVGVAVATITKIWPTISDGLKVAFNAVRGIDFGSIFRSIGGVISTAFAAIRKVDFAQIFGRLFAIVKPLIGPLEQLGIAIVKLGVAAFPVVRQAIGFVVAAAIRLKPVFEGIVVVAYVLARVGGVLLGGAIRLTANAVAFLAKHMTILKPVLFAVAAGFVAMKVVQGVQAGILGLARVAGTAVGTVQRLGGQASRFVGSMRAGATTALNFGKSIVVATFNIAKQVAAFVAQKVAMAASFIAQKALTAGQWLLNAAMDANPVTLIVAGIAALTAGVILAYQHFKPFRDVVDAVGRAFRTAFGFIEGVAVHVFGWLKSHWPLVLTILTGPFGLAVLAITKLWRPVTRVFIGTFNWVRDHWKQLAALLLFPIVAPVALIVTNFKRIIGAASAVFTWVKNHWPLIAAILTGPLGVAVLLITKNWHKIADGASTAFHAITGFFARLPGLVIGALATAGTWLLGIGKAVVGGFLDGARWYWNTYVVGFWGGIGKTVLRSLASAGSWLLSVGAKLIDGLLRGIRSGAGKVFGFFAGLGTLVLTAIGTASSWLVSTGADILSGLWQGITNGWALGTAFFADLGARIEHSLTGAASWLVGSGRAVITGLFDGIRATWAANVRFFAGLGRVVLSFVSSAASWLLDVGKSVMRGLVTGFETGLSLVVDFYTRLPGAIVQRLASAGTWLVATGGQILGGLLRGIHTGEFAVLRFLGGLGARALRSFANAGSWLLNVGANIVGGLWHGIQSGWAKGFSLFTGLGARIRRGLGKEATWLLDAGKAIIGGLFTGITTGWTVAESFFTGLAARVVGLVGRAGQWLLNVGKDVLAGLVMGFQLGLSLVIDFYVKLPIAIVRTFAAAGTWLISAGSRILVGLLHGIHTGEVAVFRFFAGLGARVIDALATAGTWLLDVGAKVTGGLWAGIKTGWANELAFWKNLPGVVIGFFARAGSWLVDSGSKIVRGMLSGLVTAAYDVLSFFTGLPSTIIHALEGILGGPIHWLFDTGVNFMQGLWDGLKSMVGKIGDWISKTAGSFVDKLTHPWKIFSPSKVTHEIGVFFFKGLHDGMREESARVLGSLDVFAAAAVKRVTPATLTPLRAIAPTQKIELGGVFVPPPIPKTDYAASRALAEQAPFHAATRGEPLVQENHFHGHDKPTQADLDYAGRKLVWTLSNTGRRPGG